MTGIGPVAVRQPRVRDREATEGARIRYSPSILPRYARRSQSLEVLIPNLNLKGISTGDFEEVLAALVGKARQVYRRRPSPASRRCGPKSMRTGRSAIHTLRSEGRTKPGVQPLTREPVPWLPPPAGERFAKPDGQVKSGVSGWRLATAAGLPS